MSLSAFTDERPGKRTPKKKRRTQAQRTQETRTRILDARGLGHTVLELRRATEEMASPDAAQTYKF